MNGKKVLGYRNNKAAIYSQTEMTDMLDLNEFDMISRDRKVVEYQ